MALLAMARSIESTETIAQLVEWWSPIYLAKLASYRAREISLRRIKEKLGTHTESTLSPDVIELMLAKVAKERNLGPQTLNHIRNAGRKLIRDAIRSKKWAGSNPFAEVDKRRVPKNEPYLPTREEIGRLLDHLPLWRQPLFATAVYTLACAQELRGLRVEDVDLVNGLMALRRSKTGSNRTVPIHRELLVYLEEAMRVTAGPWLFPRANGDQMTSNARLPQLLRVALKRADITRGWKLQCKNEKCGNSQIAKAKVLTSCPKCGTRFRATKLPQTMTFHDLRHVSSTLYQEAGVPLFVVSHLLGHSQKGVTSLVYTHLHRKEAYMREQLNKLSLRENGKVRDGRIELPTFGSGGQRSSLEVGDFPHLLTSSEVAKLLRVCRETVVRLVKAGKLPAIQVGSQHRYRFRSRDIRALLEGGGQ